MNDDYEQTLSDLYDLVSGKSFPFTTGLTTYRGRNEDQQKLHEAMLKLERRGKVARYLERADFTVWRPRQDGEGSL